MTSVDLLTHKETVVDSRNTPAHENTVASEIDKDDHLDHSYCKTSSKPKKSTITDTSSHTFCNFLKKNFLIHSIADL